MTKPKEALYPIIYNGITYDENNVDGLFDSFYYDREIYESGDGSIYISDGVSIFPDGTTKDEES